MSIFRFVGALAIFGVTQLISLAGNESKTEQVYVSIPSLSVKPKERIISFEIHIRPGRFMRVAEVPSGWEICLHNEPSWTSKISGTFAAGSFALEPKFFNKFVLIERDTNDKEVPFDMHGEIVVSEDFEHERRIEVLLKDFAFTKLTEK